MAITRVYTKTGDDGITSLVGGVKVKKTNARIEAYGTVDELSAHLGMLASWMKDGEDKDLIIRTQRNLFTVCSYLATDKTQTPLAPSYTLPAGETDILEEQIDLINANIPQQTAFILPGGSHEAALCHVARTVCRRAERRILSLHETEPVSSVLLAYVNRLSDYFYVLALRINFLQGTEEILWQK